MYLVRTVVVIGLCLPMFSACGGSGIGDTSRNLWPRDIVVGPSILSVDVPSSIVYRDADAFTFSAETQGSPVIAWAWDFGGGANPNTSNLPAPTVTLVNYSTMDSASYVCTLTVTDADGNANTVQVEYQVGRGYGPEISFADGPTLCRGNPATVVFAIDNPDDDWITVTIELLEGDGVTIEPTTMEVFDYGPYEVTVTNHMLWDAYVTIGITLDNGYFQTCDQATGIVYGIHPEPGSIAIQPVTATVSVGEAVLVEVYAFDILYPVAYFNYIALTKCDGLRVLWESWNLGTPGGDTWEKDGWFWDSFPDPIRIPEYTFFMLPDTPEWSICADGSNPVGAPPGTSGPIFNVQFIAVEPGTWLIGFVPENTHYLEPDGETQHVFTDYLGCEVTVTEAEE